MDTTETAALVKLSPRTLQRFRAEGGGPPFCMLGARVVYLRGDVLAWMRSRRSQRARAQ